MRKSVFFIFVCLAIIAIVFSVVSGFQNKRIISQLEKTITIKDDSIKILSDKYLEFKTTYKFNYLMTKVIFEKPTVKMNDTIKAQSFLCAAGLINESDVTTSIVYQVIPESYYHDLYDPNRDSLLTFTNFFSDKLPIDSGIYKNEEYSINYVPKEAGKFYLRGYFNIPSIDYYNKLHISKYPFQAVFEAY